MTYDSSSNAITIEPAKITTASGLKNYPAVMSATDSTDSPTTTAKSFGLNMYNNPPQLNQTISNQNLVAFYTLSFSRVLSDADPGDTIQADFSFTGGTMPSGVTGSYDSTTKLFSFNWTPTNSNTGSFEFSFKYWDGLRSTAKLEARFTVTVSENPPPLFASALPSTSVRECTSSVYYMKKYFDILGEAVTCTCTN